VTSFEAIIEGYSESGLILKDKTSLFLIKIDLLECLVFPGSYLSRKVYPLEGNSRLFIQSRYIPDSLFKQLVGYTLDDINTQKKKVQLSDEDLAKGVLKILLIRGKNLRPDDGSSSDPYCVFKVENYKQAVELKSKVKKKTLNPVWN
jgi:hypothetical protein